MLNILQHPPILLLSEQPVVFRLQSDATGTPLRIGEGITQEDGDILLADSEKKVTFELSDYLQGLITERGKTGDTPEVYATTPRSFTFSFLEWIGTPPAFGDELETTAYYLLDGRVPKSMSKAFYAANANLLAYLVSSKSALSWWPATEAKKVLSAQKSFINYLQVQSLTPVTIWIDLLLNFTDGTSYSHDIGMSISNVAYMKLVYFPTGYTQLGIPAILASVYPDKVLSSYCVSLKTGYILLSQVYEYTVHNNWHQHPRVLYIRNAFGLWETLLCIGKGEQNNELKHESAETDGRTYPDKFNWRTTKTDSIKVNTGPLSATQMQWLSDLDFREAYEMINGNLHPIVFKDLKLPVVHDGDYLFNADLEYEYAFNEVIEQG